MASVRKHYWQSRGERKEGWLVDYVDLSGKRRAKSFKLKRAAEKFRTQIQWELERGEHTADAETVTLREAVEAWLEDCERRHRIGDGMSGATLANYRGNARRHVIPGLGGVLLNRLSSVQVQDFINQKATTSARQSCAHMRTVLMQTIKFAQRRRWLRRNPLVDDPVRIPRGAVAKRVVPPSHEDIEKILMALSVRRPYEQERPRLNRIAITMLALFAGMRRGEIAGLQWENVDFAQGIVRVEHSFSRYDKLKSTKTKAGRREIPMATPVRNALEMLAAASGDDPLSGFVLRSRDGLHVHSDERGWFGIMQAAGLIKPDGRVKYTLHTMRHAAVSLLIEHGLDPFIIKKIIGHARISTTLDVYGHLMPENQAAREAVLQVGGDFRGTSLLLPVAPQKRPETEFEWAEARRMAVQLVNEGGMQVADVCRRLSVSLKTVYNWLAAAAEAVEIDGQRQKNAKILELSA